MEGVTAVEAQVGTSIGEDRTPSVAVWTGAVEWWVLRFGWFVNGVEVTCGVVVHCGRCRRQRRRWRLLGVSIPVGQSRHTPKVRHQQRHHTCEWVEEWPRFHEVGLERDGRHQGNDTEYETQPEHPLTVFLHLLTSFKWCGHRWNTSTCTPTGHL